jgi:2-phosphosulfolactate phosphatase
MEFHRTTLANCGAATGTVVVIDVIRAFSTAAYAFGCGARQIVLVSTVEEALNLRRRFSGSYVMGEVKGLPPPGFDFGNSPSLLASLDLTGRTLIQRTSSGTQGVTLSRNAQTLLAASFVCAGTTARYILGHPTPSVTFVVSGAHPQQRFDGRPISQGDEDAACADYLEALLSGASPAAAPYLLRVRQSPSAKILLNSQQALLPAADLEYCTALDRFDFAMHVQRQGEYLIMNKQNVI